MAWGQRVLGCATAIVPMGRGTSFVKDVHSLRSSGCPHWADDQHGSSVRLYSCGGVLSWWFIAWTGIEVQARSDKITWGSTYPGSAAWRCEAGSVGCFFPVRGDARTIGRRTLGVMDLGLHSKVVLVTGGTKGIGEAIVRAFLQEGARVVTIARNLDDGRRMQKEYSRLGNAFWFVCGDLCNTETCRRVVEETLNRYGRLDVVVNNAGINDGVGLQAGPPLFVASLERNLIHYYAIVHFALGALKQSQGVIINVGSKVSVTGQGGTSGYAAAKGAINALTREWAVELAQYGIRVNAVLPAETWTPLYQRWLETMPDPVEAKRSIEKLIPLGRRFTTADEIAATVVFLASSRSSHTTGQIIFVDGGYTHLDRRCTAV